MLESLAAGLCIYEKSLPSIKRTIESIKNHVSKIIVIDGRFDYFPDPSPTSSEEVRSYLLSIENLVLVDLCGTEVAKRQKYCDLCRQYKCEWLLIIDSDEYIMEQGNWQEFRNHLDSIGSNEPRNIYGIRFAYSYPNHMDTTPYPRLWYHPWEVTYIKHNLWQTQRQGGVKSTSECPLVDGIIMAGDDNLHTPEYIQQGRVYQEHLIKQENPHEKTWQELFEEGNLIEKLELFLTSGGSGTAMTNVFIEAIVEELSLRSKNSKVV